MAPWTEAPPLPIAVPNPNRFTETDHSNVYYLDQIDDRYWLTNIRTLLGPTPIRCPFTPLYFRAFLPLCTLADVPPSHPPSLLPHTLSKAEPRGGHPTPPQAYISLGATQSRTLQTPRNRTKTPGKAPPLPSRHLHTLFKACLDRLPTDMHPWRTQNGPRGIDSSRTRPAFFWNWILISGSFLPQEGRGRRWDAWGGGG